MKKPQPSSSAGLLDPLPLDFYSLSRKEKVTSLEVLTNSPPTPQNDEKLLML